MWINSDQFELFVNEPDNKLVYIFNDGVTSALPVNASDKLHGENLGITGLEHKVLHEITHYYIARALHYACCPVVHAQAYNLPMPENAGYLEEIVFAFVYFCMGRAMPGINEGTHLLRLRGKADVYVLKEAILKAFYAMLRSQQNITL